MNPIYYSQNGEDVILHLLFPDRSYGFFVEVGCIDGRRFSNTLTFEEMGWAGICIEAHQDYIAALKKNRPNSKVIHAAVAAYENDKVIFYANDRASLSTLDPTKENQFKKTHGKYFTGFHLQRIQQRSLTSIFEEHDCKIIDVLSIDVEGTEVDVLKGLDFTKYKPNVILVECDELQEENKIDRLLLPHGYVKAARVTQNIFYCKPWLPITNIRDKQFITRVLHTEHPLDTTGNRIVTKTINTKVEIQTPSIFRKFLSLVWRKLHKRLP